MCTKIWLKPGQGILDVIESDKNAGKLPKYIRVETHKGTDEKYIISYVVPCDPTNKFPTIPAQYYDRVTFWQEIHTNFRAEGVYRHKGAEMLLTNKTKYPAIRSTVGKNEPEILQEIKILARTLEDMVEIYSLVRQGKLLPAENWEQPAVASAPSK